MKYTPAPALSTQLFMALLIAVGMCAALHAQPKDDLREQAAAAMKQAATYYLNKVASHGGYLYYYSEDLSRRWGEGEFTAATVFVQPPGTPTVGMAYLKAFAATNDRYYLDAAVEAGKALVHGQLESGGWTQAIHFAKVQGRIGKNRNGKGGTWNASSLDDGQTQAALEFLFALDQALLFKHEVIHEAAKYGLDALLKAQYANGGFTQVFTGPAEDRPVVKAGYPDYDWKTQGRVKNYWEHYTLNDGLAGSVCTTLIAAHEVYQDPRIMEAIEKLGDFLLLAQMPEPQPGWCQQYDAQMVPIWARKFEPAAIAGSESQDAMFTLIRIAQVTGKDKYLKPIAPALDYFRKSLLPDGRLARFYELKSNKPLYMNSKYELTYESDDVPAHYGWKQGSKLDAIEKAWNEARQGKQAKAASVPKEDEIRRIIAGLDEQGRWLETYEDAKLTGQPKLRAGQRYLSSATFSKNVERISAFLKSR